MSLQLVEKYRPNKLEDVVSNTLALSQLSLFVKRNPKNKAIILYGSTGTGKTSSIYALANDLNYEVIEINASDFRNKEKIEQRLGITIKQKSLFYEGKIILIDEVDGISGTKDRGAVISLKNIIKTTEFPIVLTANDVWTPKLQELRKICELIEFKKIDNISIIKVLEKIVKKEKLKIKEEYLKTLARNSNGDLRSAINDLELFMENEDELFSEREREDSIFNALKLIFKSTNIVETSRVLDNVNMDLKEANMWIEENIPNEYRDPEEIVNAYNALSKADIFYGRIMRWQYWRFLYYYNFLSTSGVALAKNNINPNFTSYKRVQRLLQFWRAKMKNSKKKEISEAYAKHTHISKKKAFRDYNFYSHILKNNKDSLKEIGIEEINL